MAYKIFLCKRTAFPKPKEVHASQRAASKLRERLNITRSLADNEICGCHRSIADPDHTSGDCGGSQKIKENNGGRTWNKSHSFCMHFRRKYVQETVT